MRMKLRVVSLLVGVGTLALVACGGGGGTTFVGPTPGPTCAPGVTYQMIYPIPGATAVPDNPQQIAFAVSAALSGWNVVLNNANSLTNSVGTGAELLTITAGQVPSPSATPSFPSPVYQSVALNGGFSSGQTIYVWLNNLNSNCTPIGPVGSFTTQ